MAGTLESTLASIPGYGGYLAKQQYDQQQQGAELQQAHTLQKIFEGIQQQELMKQFGAAISGGGPGASASPDQLDAMAMKLAAGGHPGAAAVSALADKRRKMAADAATLKTIQSPVPAPVQSAPDPEGLKMVADTGGAPTTIPGTNFTNPTAEQVPPEERAAFDKVLNQARTTNAAARGEGGLFSTLMQSEVPAIANQARLYQTQANQSDPRSVSPQHWVDLQKTLAAQEAAYLERKAGKNSEPLQAIVGPDGKPVLVPRAQAEGKTPWSPSMAGGGEFSPEALRMTAEQYLTGDRQAVQGYARNASARIALQNEIVKVAKERGWTGADIAAQMADFAGIMSGSRSVGTRAANISLASSEANKMIGIVKEQSKNFDASSFIPWNIALKAYQTNTGDAGVKAYGASINSLVNVYARAISPSGVPTVNDKEHAREMLSTVDSPAQVNAVLGVLEQEMKAARESPDEVRADLRRAITGAKATTAGPAAAPGGKRFKFDAQGNPVK
jgi:hypothetical protein